MRRSAGPAAVLLVLLILGLAQLLLPRIAAERLRDRLAPSGSGVSVHVEAFPAVELLWHQADRIVVHMDSYRSSGDRLSALLDEATGVDSLLVTVGRLDAGLITLRDADLVKRGGRLTGSATVAEADLRQALPGLENVVPVASGAGQLVLRGTVSLLGQSISAEATLAAGGGKLVLTPDVPFGGLAALTVFANPHLHVNSILAVPVNGGFRVTVVASLG